MATNAIIPFFLYIDIIVASNFRTKFNSLYTRSKYPPQIMDPGSLRQFCSLRIYYKANINNILSFSFVHFSWHVIRYSLISHQMREIS